MRQLTEEMHVCTGQHYCQTCLGSVVAPCPETNDDQYVKPRQFRRLIKAAGFAGAAIYHKRASAPYLTNFWEEFADLVQAS